MYLCQRYLPATVTARCYGLSAQPIRNCLQKNNSPIRARRPYKGQIMTRHPCLTGCNGLDVISSGGMPTGTGFSSVMNPVLHLVMLMAELGFIAA